MANQKRRSRKGANSGSTPASAGSASSKAKKVPVSASKGAAKRGRPKKTVVSSASKGSVAASKKAKQSRKPNRYNLLRKAIADYCRRKYGRVCSNEEINEMYRELKTRFFDVDPKKQVSASEIAQTIDEKLGFRTSDDLPEELQVVNWYDIESFFRSQDGLFFQKTDKIRLETGQILGTVSFVYEELSSVYRDRLYTAIRQAMDNFEAQFGQKPSPPWTFQYDPDASQPDKRIFVWNLEVDEGQKAIAPATPPSAPPSSPSEPSDELQTLKARKELAEAEKQRFEAKTALIKEGRALLSEGVISKDEFKRYFLDA